MINTVKFNHCQISIFMTVSIILSGQTQIYYYVNYDNHSILTNFILTYSYFLEVMNDNVLI